MTGRTRRGSTSSVETIDGKRDHWRKESSLLRSVPNGTSDIEWPIYELRDAVVLNKDGQTLESALDVGFRGPFIIRGTLVLDEPEQRQNRELRSLFLITLALIISSYKPGQRTNCSSRDPTMHPILDRRLGSRCTTHHLGGREEWIFRDQSSTCLPKDIPQNVRGNNVVLSHAGCTRWSGDQKG